MRFGRKGPRLVQDLTQDIAGIGIVERGLIRGGSTWSPRMYKICSFASHSSQSSDEEIYDEAARS